ncbi:hypothetical protein [Geobacillus sp. E263]|uniref:Uncharacterized protein n=1 Tax=Parageobacillus toebii TaxID=153151 RepID=A0A150MG92_9BACL|nr:hypothetical protein [Geobacillus sp. E263]KYD23466.1 hypothetical protein B4110_3220 [Parageobacillus toebii]
MEDIGLGLVDLIKAVKGLIKNRLRFYRSNVERVDLDGGMKYGSGF